MTTEVQEITLDVLRHPAVTAIDAKRARAQQDVKRLQEIAKQADRDADEARSELGRIELEREMGGKPKGEDEAAQKIQRAEAKASEARAEAERRQAVIDGLEEEKVEAIRQAAEEITEEVEPLIRDLTQRYLESMRQTFELSQEIENIYTSLRRSRQTTYHRHQVHAARAPHDNPVIPFKVSPVYGSEEKGIKKHFDRFRGERYDI